MDFQQMSLFDIPDEVGLTAISCRSGAAEELRSIEQWMRRLVPTGEYVIDIGKHAMVLKPTNIKPEEIPGGHEFYHYFVGDRIYSGVFVGEF